jgi:hypothetical protein
MAPRPNGVVAVAAGLLCIAIYLAIAGALLAAGAIPFSWGAYWLFGMETAGPFAFWLSAMVFAVNAYGLLRMKNWARRLTLVLMIAGIVVALPSVSAAVVAVRPLSIVREGAGVIGRVAVAWYLFQEHIAAAFTRR